MCLLAFVINSILWVPLRVLAKRTSGVAGLLKCDALYQAYITASKALGWVAIAGLAVARHFGAFRFLTQAAPGA